MRDLKPLLSLAIYHARLIHPWTWCFAMLFLIVLPALSTPYELDAQSYFLLSRPFRATTPLPWALISLLSILTEENSKKQPLAGASLTFPLTRAIDKRTLFRARIALVAAVLAFPCAMMLTQGFSHPDLHLKSTFHTFKPTEHLRADVERDHGLLKQQRQLRYLERLPLASLRYLKTQEQQSQQLQFLNLSRRLRQGELHIVNGRRDKMLAAVCVMAAGSSLMLLWCLFWLLRFPGQKGLWLAGGSILAVVFILPRVLRNYFAKPEQLFESALIEFMRAPWMGIALAFVITCAALWTSEKLWIRKEAA
jgi:hypothetical protein